MKLYYATTNLGKFKSLHHYLANSSLELLHAPLDIPEPRANDVSDIAREKVRYAFTRLQQPVIVMDAGFYIASLQGFPRAYIRFALDTIGIEGILRLAVGQERACEFRECFAYVDESLQHPQLFTGRFPGTLSEEPRGTRHQDAWSDLWRIFIPEGSSHTLAEMPRQEYHAWIQRMRQDHAPEAMFAHWYRETYAEKIEHTP